LLFIFLFFNNNIVYTTPELPLNNYTSKQEQEQAICM